jgi:ribosomal protein L31
MADMAAQIKQLTASVAKLASRGQQNMENNDPNKNRGCRRDRIVEQMTKLCNMGGYCSTHGFHPVGPTHDIVTCQFKKKDEHNDTATWNNRLNGNTYWPKAIRVAIEQQDHPTWKGKDKPI